mgnify:CR=1 FL=1
MKVNIALLTVTDTRTLETDKSGAILVKKIKECNHNLIDRKITKYKKNKIFDLLKKEKIPGLMQNYQNIHLLPIFKKKIAYGNKSFPWSLNKKKYNYNKGICPIAENLNDNDFLGIEMCKFDFSKKDLDNIVNSFKKVFDFLIK